MKVAIVKQVLDVFGSWSSLPWSTPLDVFACWPSKAVYWGLTCQFQADWYVVPQQANNAFTADAVLAYTGRCEFMQRYSSNVVPLEQVPLDHYDVVITLDPILTRKRHELQSNRALLCYYAEEHWDPIYKRSMHRPLPPYDLFLDHMLAANETLSELPQAVAFPYVQAPEIARRVFCVDNSKENVAWVDFRMLTTLAQSQTWDRNAEAAKSRLANLLGMRVSTRGLVTENAPYGITDPPSWRDAQKYLHALAACRYYVSVGRISGAGQGLCDAASVGCVCIGQRDKPYHRLICHPAALCEDMHDLLRVARALFASSELRANVIAWQDRQLQEHFIDRPRALLEDALVRKAGSRSIVAR